MTLKIFNVAELGFDSLLPEKHVMIKFKKDSQGIDYGAQTSEKVMEFIVNGLNLDLTQEGQFECLFVNKDNFFKVKIATQSEYFKAEFFCSIWTLWPHEPEYACVLEYANSLKEQKALNHTIEEKIQGVKIKL